jgi:hypothetical protein
MIQRIQTVYLFLAALAGILLFFFPIADFYDEMLGNYRFFITGVESMDPNPKMQFSFLFTSPLWIITAAASLISIVTLLLYKNRIMQIRLVAFNILFIILMIVLIFLFYAGKVEAVTGIGPSYQEGVFFPLVALIFLVLANRSIRKDESKVKAADRLR